MARAAKVSRKQRPRAEDKPSHTDSLLRHFAEHSQDIMFRMSIPDGRYEYVSPGVTGVSGYTPEEHYQTPRMVLKVIPPDWHETFKQSWQEICAGNTAPFRDFPILTKSADRRWIHQRNWIVFDDSGRPVAFEGIAIDVTDRRHLEAQLQQSQKLDAVGQLANGIAHDFNNLLAVILGRTEVALALLPDGPARREIEFVQKTGKRAAALTRRLLTFSRSQTAVPTLLDINTVIHDMDATLRRLLHSGVRMATSLGSGPGRVKADRSQVEQILMNLVLNACEAMDGNGELRIETAAATLNDASAAARAGVTTGPYVMLQVSDTGCGMSDQVRTSIFDPFFTTKERGSGLGLFIVHGIVKQNGGHIEVESTPGRGTTFRVYLPRHEA